jgi:hypothetical protein
MVEQVHQAGGLIRTTEVFLEAAAQFGGQVRVGPAGRRGDRVALEQ